MGKVHEIKHLLTISFFTSSIAVEDIRREFGSPSRRQTGRRIPGTSWPPLAIREVWSAAPGLEGVVKREIPMIPNDRQLSGSIYELANDEYIQVESGPESGVVIWSSNLSVDETLRRVRGTLGDPSTNEDSGFVICSDGTKDLSSHSAENLALKNPQDIHLVVVTYGETQISWREPQIKLRSGALPYVEFCYSAGEVRWTVVRELMRLTASENVREVVTKLKDPIVRSLGHRAIA